MLRSAGAQDEGAWWTRLIGERRAQDHRAPALRRAAESSGRPAGADRRQAARRGRLAGHCAATPLALPKWLHSAPAAIDALAGEILATAPHAGELSLLVAAPGRVPAAQFVEELERAGVGRVSGAPVGSHAARFELDTARSGVFAPRS